MKVDNRQPSRRLAAIVFTDIVGYSAFVHRDELLGERLLNRQKAVVRGVLPRYGGREIKTAGDSFLLEFGSALAAVQAVIAIQQRLAAENARAAPQPPVLLRASIHLGDVEHRDHDVYGDGVNIAARLLPLSPEGGIALSAPVLGLVRQRFDLPLRSLGMPALKNITHPIEVFVIEAEALQAPEALAAVEQGAVLEPPATSSRRPLVPLLSALLALALASLAAMGYRSVVSESPGQAERAPPAVGISAKQASLPPIEQASIAVLPLINQSGDPKYEYFSDGLTEELISALAHLRELRVIGRSSSFQFKDRPTDSRVIGEMLKVGSLLEGSVRKQGSHVRIIARLINASDGSQVWSQTFDRELKDIFAVQTEIAEAVAGALKLRLLGAPDFGIVPKANLDAYNALLLGNYYYERNDRENWRQAIRYYDEAIRLDPSYAMAYAKRGITWGHLAGNYLAGQEARDAYAAARMAAQQAMALAPDLAEAHDALGWVLMIADLDVMGAEAELRRAAMLAPTEAPPKHRLAFVLSCLGRFDEGISLLRQSFQLDPLAFRGYLYLSSMLVMQGKYDEAEAAVRKALDLQPTAATNYQALTIIEIKRGRMDAALLDALREPDDYWREYAIALARQSLGDRSAADAALREFTAHHAEDGAFQIATLYALRDERDEAFAWLDKAHALRDPAITGVRQDPFLAAYQADPRYAAFCRRIGVPPP
ncbi:MAG: adenylate/guanylate cyclase domain-containing protein [Nevskia sp.]